MILGGMRPHGASLQRGRRGKSRWGEARLQQQLSPCERAIGRERAPRQRAAWRGRSNRLAPAVGERLLGGLDARKRPRRSWRTLHLRRRHRRGERARGALPPGGIRGLQVGLRLKRTCRAERVSEPAGAERHCPLNANVWREASGGGGLELCLRSLHNGGPLSLIGPLALFCWRGQANSASRGGPGQRPADNT